MVPARVTALWLARAASQVEILAALRANALAFFSTQAGHRQPQQDLFSQYVGQLYSRVFIKSDLCVGALDRNVFLLGDHAHRVIEKVEIPVELG